MQAVVLAGGYATRMWPITRHRPKMLLPVGETTVIDRVLEELEADDRIEDVYLSTNERFVADFESHVADRGFEKPRLSVEQTESEDEKFGVVGALAQLVEREGIEGEDLLVVAGDNLMGFDLGDFLDEFDERGTSLLAAYDVGDRERAKSYGLVNLEDDHIVEFQEKPDDPKSTLVSIACYAFPAASVRFGEYLADGNNPDEPGWFIKWLVDQEEVGAFTFEEAWFDIGTPESYLDAVGYYLDGETLVEDGATVDDSDLGANVHVLEGATVDDSRLEHTVVFPGSTIKGSELRRSVVDREAHVENLDLAGALVGAHTFLSHGD